MTVTKPKDRNAEVDFRGQKRSNTIHASVTDPETRLYRKSPGTGASLCFIGHTLMENRNGLMIKALDRLKEQLGGVETLGYHDF